MIIHSVRDWLGKGVHVYAGYDWRKQHGPIARGEVIAVIDGPSVIVRDASGQTNAWPLSLPIDAMCSCGHSAELHPNEDEPACTDESCGCHWWFDGREDWREDLGPSLWADA